MPTLSIHIKTSEKGAHIKGKRIVLTYFSDGESGVIAKSLKHRKVNHLFALSRKASEEEMKSESSQWRITFLSYSDWDTLIEDEKKWVDDEKWISSIQELRKKFPQFENKCKQPEPKMEVQSEAEAQAERISKLKIAKMDGGDAQPPKLKEIVDIPEEKVSAPQPKAGTNEQLKLW
jgi:hypothetical protein